MIFSRTVEHAIRALIYLADLPEGRYAMVKDIAEHEKIPAHFLAKILQQLARQGMLRSNKGPTGGFRLREPAGNIRLLDVVTALDGGSSCERCIAGFPECTDDVPCPCTTRGKRCVRVSWIIWGGTRSAVWRKRFARSAKR